MDRPVSQRPILLVDDSPDIREAFTFLMELEGFKVIAADSGPAGLEILKQNDPKPLIVILDLTMPGMDGREFLKVRNADNIALDVPILVFSAHHQTEILAGTVGWAKKPMDVDNLIALIRKHT